MKKSLLKIIGLVSLINGILLYGAERPRRAPLSVDTELADLEDRARHGSARLLQQQHDFAQQYDPAAGQALSSSCPRVLALIDGFKDPRAAAAARGFLSRRTPAELTLLNTNAPSPTHRGGRLDTSDSTQSGCDKQEVLLETLITAMTKDLEQQERIHMEESAQSAQQHRESGAQAERLTRRNHCFMAASWVISAASLTWGIVTTVTKNS